MLGMKHGCQKRLIELLAPGTQEKNTDKKEKEERREVENVLKAKMPLAYVA